MEFGLWGLLLLLQLPLHHRGSWALLLLLCKLGRWPGRRRHRRRWLGRWWPGRRLLWGCCRAACRSLQGPRALPAAAALVLLLLLLLLLLVLLLLVLLLLES